MKKKPFLRSGGWGAILSLSLALGAYLVLVFFPGMREIRALHADTAVKRSQTAEALRQAGRLPEIEREVTAVRDFLKSAGESSCTTHEIGRAFGTIAELVKTSGAAVTVFRPEPKESLATIDRARLLLGCRGTYAQLQSLLSSIEELPLRIWVEELVLEKGSSEGDIVACEVKLAIFADKAEISD